MTHLQPPSSNQILLTAAKMRAAEGRLFASGIPAQDLMARAGEEVAKFIHHRYHGSSILVLCGPGNNGGDGFIAAKHLRKGGHAVTVCLLAEENKLKGDAAWARAEWGGAVVPFAPALFENHEIIIDAIFGIGLNKPITGGLATVIAMLHLQTKPIIAIDVPSGIDADSGEILGMAVKATSTVTFAGPKLGHYLYPGRAHSGELVVADIGLGPLLAQEEPVHFLNSLDLWAHLIPKQDWQTNKYSRGKLLVAGGKMIGAAILSVQAARKIGAGYVSLVTPKRLAKTVSIAHPGIVTHGANFSLKWGRYLRDPRIRAVLLGPGLGRKKSWVLKALARSLPTVLDADALTLFIDRPWQLFEAIHAPTVLTPHAGEFARLFPEVSGGKVEQAVMAARISGAVVVFKGADTVIANPDGRAINNINAS
ncbi:MAG: NAD(P)H-hydrate epimerase, partial [Dongiaceae bacterium]